jgi:glycerophosphoryl diester phosphodiesterase
LTAAELSRVDAGYHFTDADGRHPFRGQGVGIPTLRAVLDRYKDAAIIVEMKPDTGEMARAVVAEIRRAGAEDRVCAAGYGSRSLTAVRSALPQMSSSASRMEVRLALYRSWLAWPLSRPAYGGYQVPERVGRLRVVSPRFIRHAHRAGLEVQVWTVDDADDARRLLGWGADALISNRPDVAVAVRNDFLSAAQSSAAQRP